MNLKNNVYQRVEALPEDESWMFKALALAHTAEEKSEVPVGALLVKDNKIIGQGYNQVISTHDPTAHAEIVAIRDACQTQGNYRLVNTTLYVTLEPCSMCLGAIVHARIDRIVFAAEEPKSGMLVSHEKLLKSGVFNHDFSITPGVCQKYSSELISNFFSKRREEKRMSKQRAKDITGLIKTQNNNT